MSVKDSDMVNQHTTKKADEINALIGSSADTGGSETDGTAMAKLNQIIKKILSVADKETQDAIFSKIYNDVAGVTAQTKAFTEYACGTINNSKVTVTGKSGVAQIYNGGNCKIWITVDGKQEKLVNYLPSGACLLVYFENSITIRESYENTATYHIQT